MNRLTRPLIISLVVGVGLPVIVVSGQTARERVGTADEGNSAVAAISAREMFDDAQAYATDKQAELEKQKTKIDEGVRAKLRKEQREVAAKFVESLRARGAQTGENLYYFGRLQYLAGDEGAALDSLRLFLALSSDSQTAQLARLVAISCALKRKFIAEAEQLAADYEAREPRNFDQQFEMENQFAAAYRSATDFENMAKHATAMYKMAKHAMSEKSCQMAQCDEMLGLSVSLVAEAYLKQNRPDDALAVFERLEKFAMARPSASLFMLAAQRFKQFNPSIDPFCIFDDAADVSQKLPELKAVDWVDMQPVKFSELQGHVVLLDFWATWCGPCRMTFPDLRNLNATYKDKGLVIIGVTRYFGGVEGRKMTREQELAYLREFKKNNELPYGFAVGDSDEDVTNYGVYGIPTYVLIDRHGNVRLIGMGANGSSDASLARAIKRLMEEPAASAHSTAQ